MKVDASAYGSVWLLVGMAALVVIFVMRTGWKISRWEGALLIIINLIRWIMDFSR